MGIPKFFRWITERYPLCSQLIEQNNVPEFDNLYLDMNGIIHNCSHPDDGVHFRLTEDQMFTAIFNYIDFLFLTIKPKKLFFMALDGVAPRAKMNQQRARRFRTAYDAEKERQKAIQNGEKLPEQAPFDSNCITPAMQGTEFMAKLTLHLKYFINKKISEDRQWRNVTIVLSGHEVPGEGEHKIMEYIRLSKSKPEHDPNVRHCLYGLDADLIMLGLVSHDSNFALLREEVVFGRSKQRKQDVSQTKFFLMQLCLVREYIDKEFSSLKGQLSFEYSLERVIDDFVLIAMFVGNDFVPHLPHVHINEGGFKYLFDAYRKILPELDGYVNEFGSIALGRLQRILNQLYAFEKEYFEKKYGFKKTKKLSITVIQKEIFNVVKKFVSGEEKEFVFPEQFNALLPEEDKRFLRKLVNELNLEYVAQGTTDSTIICLRKQGFAESDDSDSEAVLATHRILNRYENADIIDANVENELVPFEQWKSAYYHDKLKMDYNDKNMIRQLVYDYIQGIQWVAFYYYRGVSSWGWFYPHHYAPFISDIQGIDSMKFKFDLGTPFKPFEQLMGVLPAASRFLIPSQFRDLMTEAVSPIIDFYPTEFETDMNDKKAAWEAVVLIPFIDQKRLLEAMNNRYSLLTEEEKRRNSFGTSLAFHYDPTSVKVYPSSLPGCFPPITYCQCISEEYLLPTVEEDFTFEECLRQNQQIVRNFTPGFPSLFSVPHSSHMAAASILVFNTESKSESLVIQLDPMQLELDKILEHLETVILVGYPFLSEAKFIALTDGIYRYEKETVYGVEKIKRSELSEAQIQEFKSFCETQEFQHMKRKGIVIGETKYVAAVRAFIGMDYLDDGSLKKKFDSAISYFPLQTTVLSVTTWDERYIEHPPRSVADEFPIGSNVFYLGHDEHYGRVAQVIGHPSSDIVDINIQVPNKGKKEIMFPKAILLDHYHKELYTLMPQVCRIVGISTAVLSRITSSCHVFSRDSDNRSNIGLNIKYESKGQKVLGYTRRSKQGWEYSDRAISLIRAYKDRFPQLFKRLEANKRKDPLFDQILFEGNTKEALREIKEWIEAHASSDMIKVPVDVEAADKNAIGEMEKALNDYYAKYDPMSVQIPFSGVNKHLILNTSIAHLRLKNQKFKIGDRIISVLDSGSIPCGSKGTVVGIYSDEIDVVFDIPFLSGTILSGRCSLYRGGTVENNSVLNLTNVKPPTNPVIVKQNVGKKIISPKPRPQDASYTEAATKNLMEIIQKGVANEKSGKVDSAHLDKVNSPVLVPVKLLDPTAHVFSYSNNVTEEDKQKMSMDILKMIKKDFDENK